MEFIKMEGLGNDYVFVDMTSGGPDLDWPEVAREVSSRHFGIGSDGLILVMPPQHGGDFRMRIFNADGSEAQMCGNGIRCFARYVYESGLTQKTLVHVETLAGIIRPEILLKDGQIDRIRVDMGAPNLNPEEIPCTLKGLKQGLPSGVLIVETKPIEVVALSVGNPHCIIVVPDVESLPLNVIGPGIEKHKAFPERTNVELVQVLSRHRIRVRVWERGSGITLACGTGACASAVACMVLGMCHRKVKVELPGGDLTVEWGEDGHVHMTGPAYEVFRGVYTRSCLGGASV